MYGELFKVCCQIIDILVFVDYDLDLVLICIVCGVVGCLCFYVVWFGEMFLEMECIYIILVGCECFISIGISGNVYFVVGFVVEVCVSGVYIMEFNLEFLEQFIVFYEYCYGCVIELVFVYVCELFIEMSVILFW